MSDSVKKEPIQGRVSLKNDLFLLGLFGLVYFFAHQIAFFFPDSKQLIMLIWPAGGVSLTAFLLLRKKLWPAMAITFFLLGISDDYFIAGRSIMTAIGYMTANMVESILIASLIRYFSKDFQNFSRIKEVILLIVGAFVVNAFSACIGALTSFFVKGVSFTESWMSWYISDGLGILVVAPFITVWFSNLKNLFKDVKIRIVIEGIICLTVWIVLTHLIFYPADPKVMEFHPYFLVSLLVWPSIRFGIKGTTIALLVLFVMAILSPSIQNGPSPWAGHEIDTLTSRLIELQIFLAFLSIVGYLLSSSYENLFQTEKLLREKNNQLIISQEQLEKRKKAYKDVVETTSDLITIVNSDGIISYVNYASTHFFGLSPEECIGRSAFDFIHPDDKNFTKNNFDEWKRSGNERFSFENRQVHVSGSVINALWNIHIERKNNEIIKITSIARDITELKKFEEELLLAKEKAIESDQLKSAFLANMSHEIRTPMNGILGFSQRLGQLDLPESKRKHYIDIIHNSGKQLISIIDDLIDISKIEANQLSIVITPVNVCEILNELETIFASRMALKNNVLKLNLAKLEENCSVLTDENRLRQILINLIGNAFKFTNNGVIQYGFEIKNNFIEFYVTDTGIGIPKEMQDKVFNRFTQVETEYSKIVGGTGLGLAISKSLVELLGGSIWLESEPAKGSTFFFTIPFKSSTKPIKPNTDNTPELNPKLNENLILIAEDEDDNYFYLSELLSDAKIRTIHARNGKEAVQLVHQNKSITLVLMDLKMPLMNGIEATKEIKSFRPDLPIIAQTAYAQSSDRDKAIDAGCDDYLSKPIFEDKLFQILKNYII